MSTIFGKIIKGELPCEKVYEDETILAIKDKYPQAPVHLLIMPKKEYRDLQSLPEEDMAVLADIVRVAKKLAHEFEIEEGYRLLTNNGAEAGQTVHHLHFHLLGGRGLGALG
jgi:histidine triad (HIT) family protein